MENKYFTIYWLGGRRQVVQGDTIGEAFTRAGYGNGAVKAVDWYDDGVTETHYWDKEKKTWVKYEPIHIHQIDFASYSKEQLLDLFQKHHGIVIDFDTQDQVIFQRQWGCFAKLGWMCVISLFYGEYYEGSYSGNPEDGDHHYMAANGEYFNPALPLEAIEALMHRMKNDPWRASSFGSRLEVIKEINPCDF